MAAERRTDKWSFGIFCIILLSYLVVFTMIAIWRYDNFLVNYESGDLTIFEQVIYNTLHGRPFYSTVDDQNHFGVHNSPILTLLVPFAAIISVPYLLYSVTILSIVVSAIPVYLIAREELQDEMLALILGSCYIMLPALVGQVYQPFHEINLVLPFLTFSFYYFVKERFYPFLVMFILSLMVKEDVSITLFMFAVYAVIKKRDMKWCLFPGIASVVWFFLSIRLIVPFFNKNHFYPMVSYLSDLGDSFSEIAKNILLNPMYTFYRLFLPYKLFYLYVLFLPVGLVPPFLSTEILFIIPSLFLNLLAESSRFRLVKTDTPYGEIFFPRHMSLMATVFLFMATIYSIKKIGSLSGKHATLARYALSILLMITVGYGSRFIIMGYLHQRPAYVASVESIKKVLAQIPRQATVRADNDIAAHLYDRREVNPPNNVDTDYLILSGKFYAYKVAEEGQLEPFYNYADAPRIKNLLLFNNVGTLINISLKKYDLAALDRGIVLFRKKKGNSTKKLNIKE